MDLTYIVNHVFLPPKLPQSCDTSKFKAAGLLDLCHDSLVSFKALSIGDEPSWDRLIKMVHIMKSSEGIPSDKTFEAMTPGDILALHIHAQNAGIIVRRHDANYSFESFELSPTTDAVMGTKGRLQRSFPGPAVAIPEARVKDPAFLSELLQFLSRLDTESITEACPTTNKGHSYAVESRQTVYPMFVTEMLTGILRGVGDPQQISRIRKHTRDDVLWKNTLDPWRRSPDWLLLRVVIQATLMDKRSEIPHSSYKAFMIFFMSQILQQALAASMPSDMLFVMSAKISRRVLKLKPSEEPTPWLEKVHEVVAAAHEEVTKRWKFVEENPDPEGTQKNLLLADLSCNSDTALTLRSLRPYLRKVHSRIPLKSDLPKFNLGCRMRIEQKSSSPDQVSSVIRSYSDNNLRNLPLADIELWVQKYLGEWLEGSLGQESSCTALAQLIDEYIALAMPAYEGLPENISIMILTLMELWVALDKCATTQQPLLKEYQTGFPAHGRLFSPLLLPKKGQMERLASIEQYIAGRTKAAFAYPPIFAETNTENSFAVRYFDQSNEHQSLRREIEDDAQAERIQKKAEFAQKLEQQKKKLEEVDKLECTTIQVTEGRGRRQRTYMKHVSRQCGKCSMLAEAQSISIKVHEWPLPGKILDATDLEAKSTVFELSVPPSISKWRDTTYQILVDVLSPPISNNSTRDMSYLLSEFDDLQIYKMRSFGRVQLASTTKSFQDSHYRSQLVLLAEEESICVKHGLRYSIFDSTEDRWTKDLLNQCNIQKQCTFQLPSGPFTSLQYAVNATNHTSNHVLAYQSHCPSPLTLHEYYAFGTLRAGHLLQWRNIAREVASGVLNFNHEETLLLILQAAWQVGDPSGSSLYRQSHIDLGEEGFGLSLISELDTALTNVERNWQGACARARLVTLRWTRDVLRLLHNSRNEEIKEFTSLALELALTCYGTFDVDIEHLSQILQSPESLAVITHCAIIVHDRCPVVTISLPDHIQSLLQRYYRLGHLVEPHLRQNILVDPRGLDETIQEIWAGYEPGVPWTALPAPNERWLVAQTSESRHVSSSQVHFNVLDGSLLVNRSPLTRLPRHYEEHATYYRLFKEKALDVVPSKMVGMTFETRREIHGQKIYFAMYSGELIIRTRKGNNQEIQELLPDSALASDFPKDFISDYAHWLDIETHRIEWRPLKEPLSEFSNKWHSPKGLNGKRSLVQGSRKLIDIRSSTARSISRSLSPLEDAPHIQIFFDSTTDLLEIHLPRFKLDFFVEKNSPWLKSKQFRGMAVDTNQAFGSLTGLVNKLVLVQIDGASRLVLVPDGKPSFTSNGHHVRVLIQTPTDSHILCHQYRIDEKLGLLEDNRSLRSHLFRIYLHALTSHCLPDSLTGRTGTEEALFALSAASTKSFLELKSEEIGLLKCIKSLTPRREYYPQGQKLMQTVSWDSLSPLSQHESFSREVDSIITQAKTLHLFQAGGDSLPKIESRSPVDLLEKAAIRNSTYRVHQFGADDYTTNFDTCYKSRDRLTHSSKREAETCRMVKLVDVMSLNLRSDIKLLEMIKSWRVALGAKESTDIKLGFELQWLSSPNSFLPEIWCTLHKLLSNNVLSKDKAFATVSKFRRMHIPQHAEYQLHEGYAPNTQELINIFETKVRLFELSDESKLPKLNDSELEHDADVRRRQIFNQNVDENIKLCVDYLIVQWDQKNTCPSIPLDHNGGECDRYIEVTEAVKLAGYRFDSWRRNVEFRNYIQKIQTILDKLPSCYQITEPYVFSVSAELYQPERTFFNFADLLRNPPPTISTPSVLNLDFSVQQCPLAEKDAIKMKKLLEGLSSVATGTYEADFIQDLRNSFHALCDGTATTLSPDIEAVKRTCSNYLASCQKHAEYVSKAINDALQPAGATIVRDIARKSHLLPRLSSSIILSQLARGSMGKLSTEWKQTILNYGLAIANLQRAERLVSCGENKTELIAELSNPGHVGWNPMDTPEWLVLEVENNILIRQEQAQIGRQMIKPESGRNSIMQLNMGLGKSSVIVPIVAAALADGTKLVRIVVLRPLSKQMFDLLIQKLGGMINRRIFYMPISRSLQFNASEVQQIHQLYKDCMHSGGVLLVQPEHLLSFELMGLDQSLQGDRALGEAMVRTQKWLKDNSRDILDESDEILSIHFELIYTMGTQRSIDFSPDQWTIIALVLGTLNRFAPGATASFPHGLELIPTKPGAFPRIRILKQEAGIALLSKVARDLCETGVPGVPLWKLPRRVRDILFEYLTEPTMPESKLDSLRHDVFDIDSMRLGLLLLRGLFAHGILNFTFSQKRWRVNYGLDLSRTMLAVPYHAKDTPSARAEFSHPDTTIVLTCLSYYYRGLTDSEMFASFQKLLRCDSAQQEYDQWTRNISDIPVTFVKVSGINLSNTQQCRDELFPKLRYSKGLIDFYMSHLVFPKEIKEFPHKLSSSGWDIARDKSHPTTGFSGTNDSRFLLPISIKQCDLPQLLSTNAGVLNCLLRTENIFDMTHTSNVEVLDAEKLIDMAMRSEPPARVILDVGAQVLELRNEEVAKKWLSMVEPTEADAVIFFDDDNDLSVVNRDGIKELLLVSPFLKQMGRCLVFLDEAHTRGTDLKLPNEYRAIVTLGPDLTKDRLLQACMRMRKLGKGQSVILCGPLEVQQKILESNSKKSGDFIHVADVLKWCIRNTWTHTRKCVPLWGTQGVRHYQRRAAFLFSNEKVTDNILEPEAQTLEERYGFDRRQVEERIIMHNTTDSRLSTFTTELKSIRQKCREFGLASFTNATLQEEQERELQPEQEREQEVERPPSMKPELHRVHPDVQLFVTTGQLEKHSNAFLPAFKTLLGTTAAAGFNIRDFPEDLLVTYDFAMTIVETGSSWLKGTPTKKPMDLFMRPVHWILSSSSGTDLQFVIISPSEVNELMPLIREHKKVTLHVYSPRLSLSYGTLENFSFCALPPVPVSWRAPNTVLTELNLFSGQLYLRNYFEYKALCTFLGLCSEPPGDETKVGPDGFIDPAANGTSSRTGSKFKKSPVGLVRQLVAIRCKGQDFSSSHMGKMLNGELLCRGDFEDENE